MAAFGFAVGDFIDGIILAKDVVQALSDSRGSSKEYSETRSQLDTLQLALAEIENQFADLQSSSQWTVLSGILTSCRAVVDDFLQSIEKYHVSLSRKSPKSVWKDALRKIQWQLCMPEDLTAFNGKLTLHVCTIGMLLHTIQYTTITSQRIIQRDENIAHTSHLHKVYLSLQGVDQKLDSVERNQSKGFSMQEQIVQVLESTRAAMTQQYQLLAQIHTPIPARVLFSAPVVLRDAQNRPALFNLEFIDCWESLFCVLQNLFRNRGAKKIERQEFLLEKGLGREIRFNQSWSASFSPGDQVDMTMLIRSPKTADKVVGPSCLACKDRDFGIERNCENCGSNFRRILDVTNETSDSGSDSAISGGAEPLKKARSLKRKRKGADDALHKLDYGDSDSDEQPERYKRVQVYCRPPAEQAGTHKREVPSIASRTATMSDPMSLDMDGSPPVLHEVEDATAVMESNSLVSGIPRNEQPTQHETRNISDYFYGPDNVLPRSPLLRPIRPRLYLSPSPPPFMPDDCSSPETYLTTDAETPQSSDFQASFYGIPLSEKSKREKTRHKQRHNPSQGDTVLLNYLSPNRMDLASEAALRVLDSASQSEVDSDGEEEPECSTKRNETGVASREISNELSTLNGVIPVPESLDSLSTSTLPHERMLQPQSAPASWCSYGYDNYCYYWRDSA